MTRPSWTSSSSWAGSWCAGGAGTSTSVAPQRSRRWPTVRFVPRAIRTVAALGRMGAATPRRKGIGGERLEPAVGWAKEPGVTKLELHVFPWNEPAIKLYEQFGFEREGYRKAHYRRGLDEVDAIL